MHPAECAYVALQSGLGASYAPAREQLAIRRAEAKRGLPRTPILAVSANVMAHQIEEYLAAGMDAVVAKPVQAAVLFGEMEKALSIRAGPPYTAQAAG